MTYFNGYNINQVERILKYKKKRKKIKKRKIFSFIVICSSLFALFVIPTIDSYEICGITDSNLQKKIDVKVKEYKNSSLIGSFFFKGHLEHQLEKMDEVINAEVKLKKSSMIVNIIEASPIAFASINNQNYYVNELGNVVPTSSEIKDTTLCMNFDSISLLKEFGKKYCLIEGYIQNEISDVIYIQDKLDPYLVELNLNNGNVIKLSFQRINDYLNSSSYNYLLSKMKGYKGYIFSIEGRHIYVNEK